MASKSTADVLMTNMEFISQALDKNSECVQQNLPWWPPPQSPTMQCLWRNIWLNHIVSNKPWMKVIFKEHASSYFHINAGSLRFLSLYLRCFLFSSTTFSISSVPILEFILMTQQFTPVEVVSPTNPTM